MEVLYLDRKISWELFLLLFVCIAGSCCC